jgi:hypothetical protein
MDNQLAWAAGFVESGGQLSRWKGGISLRLMRKDAEPFYRLKDLTGVGEILEPGEDRRARFSYVASDNDVVTLIRLLQPMLGPSFLARASHLLGESMPAALETSCSFGDASTRSQEAR